MIWIIPLVVVLYLLACIRILRQYERGVVFTLGKFTGVREAGFRFVFVPFQQMVRVSLRTVTMQIPSQKIITKDNVSIDIAAVAYYKVTDPEKSVIQIENVQSATNQISQTTVRNVVGQFSLDQLLLADTLKINEQIKSVIDRAYGAMGSPSYCRRNQRHSTAGQYAARDGQGGGGRTRAPRQDRCRRR
jgi:regulator of protease activity HflC (stomatin/prohibitin superfamily)